MFTDDGGGDDQEFAINVELPEDSLFTLEEYLEMYETAASQPAFDILTALGEEGRLSTSELEMMLDRRAITSTTTFASSNILGSYTTNADYNAGKNVARKLTLKLQRGQKSLAGGAFCQYALKSGTMTVNATEVASDQYVSAERESTDKPTTSVVGH